MADAFLFKRDSFFQKYAYLKIFDFLNFALAVYFIFASSTSNFLVDFQVLTIVVFKKINVFNRNSKI
jgi:hypothetical protein